MFDIPECIMNRVSVTILLLVSLLFTVRLYSQTVHERVCYYPIAPGNSWTYQVTVDMGSLVLAQYDTTITIQHTDTVIALNGHRYWQSSWGPVRMDSSNASVWIHPSANWCTDSTEREFVRLSLDSAKHHYICWLGTGEFWDSRPTSQTEKVEHLDVYRTKMVWTAIQETRVFADSIGLCFWQYWRGNRVTWRLKHANVYGTEYFPVQLAAFNAIVTSAGVQLDWHTTGEIDNMGFDVQRREGDQDWKSRGFVTAIGEQGGGRYSWLDTDLPDGATTLHYRLRQIDFSGAESYSPEVVVHRADALAHARSITVYPNPARDEVELRFIGMDMSETWTVQIIDLLGRAVLKREVRPIPHFDSHLRLDVRGLPGGVYVVTAISGEHIVHQRMVLTGK
jgi:hypothetical protein